MNYHSFEVNLRTLIESRGMTLQSFGEEINIPSATLSRYLSGHREPRVSYLVKIAAYFGVTIDWLLGLNCEKCDTLTEEAREIISLYNIATEDDRKVIEAVLRKYRRNDG